MTIMPCRYQVLAQLIAGYERSGIPLISWSNGILQPFSYADDPGQYHVIPQIAYLFQLSLDTALSAVYNGLTIIALGMSGIGFLLYYDSWIQRIIACVMLGNFGLWLISSTGDSYRMYAIPVIATVPLLLYFTQKKSRFTFFAISMVLFGFLLSLSSFFRSHAATPTLLFMGILVGATSLSWRKKGILTLLFCFGWCIPTSYFAYAHTKHADYVTTHFPKHVTKKTVHPFWHSVYIGFGLLHPQLPLSNTKQDFCYTDACAIKRVEASIPAVEYPSEASEQLLKNELITLLKKDRFFVLCTIGAKIGMLCILFLLFGYWGLGLLATYFYPKGWVLESAFASALALSSITGILIVPLIPYMIGFISYTVLYTIVSIDHAYMQIQLRRQKK